MNVALAPQLSPQTRPAPQDAGCRCGTSPGNSRESARTSERLEVRTSIARELDFAVRTSDGDTVRVRLLASEGSDLRVRTSSDGDIALRARSWESTRLRFEAQGDLDESEQAAIAALAGQAAAIAERFFAGEDLDPAQLTAALDLAPEIATFDFSVQQRSERVTKVASYRDVAANSGYNGGGWRRALESLIGTARPDDGRFDHPRARADIARGIAAGFSRLG